MSKTIKITSSTSTAGISVDVIWIGETIAAYVNKYRFEDYGCRARDRYVYEIVYGNSTIDNENSEGNRNIIESIIDYYIENEIDYRSIVYSVNRSGKDLRDAYISEQFKLELGELSYNPHFTFAKSFDFGQETVCVWDQWNYVDLIYDVKENNFRYNFHVLENECNYDKQRLKQLAVDYNKFRQRLEERLSPILVSPSQSIK